MYFSLWPLHPPKHAHHLVFIFPRGKLDGNRGKKIKIEVVFKLGKANNLRLNYPALNQTLKEIILMLLEVDPRT